MKDNPLNRLGVKRGSELPWAKLDEDDVRAVRSLIEHRNALLAEARDLTNARIAVKMDVHVRTIDRISAGETWTHVA